MPRFNYVIYQVNVKVEFAFMDWDWTEQHDWSFNQYYSVWNGTEKAKSLPSLLESLFRTFNLTPPEGYRAHSMSTSDVVRVDDENNNTKYYYCDSIGWVDITRKVLQCFKQSHN